MSSNIFDSFKERGSKIEFDLFVGFITLQKNHYLNFITKKNTGLLILNFNIIEYICTVFFFEHSLFYRFSLLKTFTDYAKNSLIGFYRLQQKLKVSSNKKAITALFYPITHRFIFEFLNKYNTVSVKQETLTNKKTVMFREQNYANILKQF